MMLLPALNVKFYERKTSRLLGIVKAPAIDQKWLCIHRASIYQRARLS